MVLVLRSPTQPSYEPIKLAFDRDLALKTCFFFTLVSAKKVNESCGLSYEVKY